jgi:hypothetical protein
MNCFSNMYLAKVTQDQQTNHTSAGDLPATIHRDTPLLYRPWVPTIYESPRFPHRTSDSHTEGARGCRHYVQEPRLDMAQTAYDCYYFRKRVQLR